jgi:hypothetical protein
VLAVTSISAASQAIPHPYDSSAEHIGVLPISGQVAGKATRIEWHVHVWRRSSGVCDFMIDVATIRFSGDPEGANQTPTSVLFDEMSLQTGELLQALGHNVCQTQLYESYVLALAPSSVSRDGSGILTSFTTCGGAVAARLLVVQCSSGLMTLRSVTPQPDCEVQSECECTIMRDDMHIN